MALNECDAPSLADVQARRRRVLAVSGSITVLSLLFIDTIWRAKSPAFYENIELVGIYFIFIGIVGRTWCTLYIGGRKKETIVQNGPYSIVRNPLYVFSLFGAAGIGAQSGSLAITAFVTLAVASIFYSLVKKEERFLHETFGAAYQRYALATPRFIPDFRLWRDVDELEVKPALVRKTFADAVLFMLAIPLADIIELAQQHGWLPVLLRLP
jgi:protein-S-isoprenylcysteine O-methyltransferase Ste14